MRPDPHFVLAILLVGGSLLGHSETSTAVGQERASVDQDPSGSPSGKAATAEAAAPPLSVDTLYGPEKAYDYDGPEAPPHRWFSRDKASLLAIKREPGWRLLDPASGNETDWTLPDRLAHSLSTLPQVSEEQAEAIAERLLQRPESSLDRSLVRIDQGYAIVGTETRPQWITRDADRWRNVTLSPVGTHVAYTIDNDLHVYDISSESSRALTTGGSETQLNGILDWSYQEELYGRGNFKGFWWSPDGSKLAFLRLNVQNVHEYTIADSATPRGQTRVARYPKVGDPIPEAELWVADVEGALQPLHQISPQTKEHLIVRVSWHPDSQRVAYQLTDRLQSWLELRLADARFRDSGSTATTSSGGTAADQGSDAFGPQSGFQRLLRDSSPAWVEVLGEPIWLNNEDFLWLSDQPLGRRRLWRINELGKERIPVTPEKFLVRSLGELSPDKQNNLVVGDADRGTRGQQLYRATIPSASAARGDHPNSDPRVTERDLQRLTTEEGWHEVRVGPNQQWMVDSFSTVDSPPRVTLVHIPGRDEAPHQQASEPPIVLRAPSELPADWVAPKWIEVTVADAITLPGYYLRPRNVEGPVPVLIETYGGPLAPSAVDRWAGARYLYRQFLVQQGIAVLVVDNRSSAGRGIADSWSIHRQMGVLELHDLLAFVDWLKRQRWADSDQIGIRGWSFGGYLTAYALTHSDAFAAGVAGGSPTDWRNYDAIYTERYMGLPEQNAEGYARTSVLNAAEDLHGRLLLIHGELDDNVHLANTFQLTAALQKAGKQFDLMVYPGAAHGVHHPQQVHHMMTMITQFLLRHLVST